jgi:predicted small secreted protein
LPPPALYQAAAKKTISKGKVFKILRDDFKAADPDVSFRISKVQKEGLLDPPYVVWYVEATSTKPAGGGMREWQWEFKIDAFTGEIIQKRERPIDSVSDPLR